MRAVNEWTTNLHKLIPSYLYIHNPFTPTNSTTTSTLKHYSHRIIIQPNSYYSYRMIMNDDCPYTDIDPNTYIPYGDSLKPIPRIHRTTKHKVCRKIATNKPHIIHKIPKWNNHQNYQYMHYITYNPVTKQKIQMHKITKHTNKQYITTNYNQRMTDKQLTGNKRSKKEMEKDQKGDTMDTEQEQTPNKKRKISSPNRKMRAFKLAQQRESEKQNKETENGNNGCNTNSKESQTIKGTIKKPRKQSISTPTTISINNNTTKGNTNQWPIFKPQNANNTKNKNKTNLVSPTKLPTKPRSLIAKGNQNKKKPTTQLLDDGCMIYKNHKYIKFYLYEKLERDQKETGRRLKIHYQRQATKTAQTYKIIDMNYKLAMQEYQYAMKKYNEYKNMLQHTVDAMDTATNEIITLKKQLEVKCGQLARNEKKVQTMEKKTEKAESERKGLEQALKKNKEEKQKLENENDKLSTENNQLSTDNEQLKTTIKELKEKLEKSQMEMQQAQDQTIRTQEKMKVKQMENEKNKVIIQSLINGKEEKSNEKPVKQELEDIEQNDENMTSPIKMEQGMGSLLNKPIATASIPMLGLTVSTSNGKLTDIKPDQRQTIQDDPAPLNIYEYDTEKTMATFGTLCKLLRDGENPEIEKILTKMTIIRLGQNVMAMTIVGIKVVP